MTRERKIKLFIAVAALFICLFQIRQTYSKYTESKNGNVDFTVASWKILLNDEDISSGGEMSSIINPVYDANNNIASGVIAPTSSGYFDLEIDAAQTEVSFSYTISISSSEQTDVEDLVITGYKIGNGDVTPVQNNINNLTNTIAHNAPNKTVQLRIYFKWIEGESESEQMDNSTDTAVAISGGTGKINVSATFTQIANS